MAANAVYQKLGGEAWGHSVAGLLDGLRERVQVGDDVAECGRVLDRFYIPARYPNSWERGTPGQYHSKEDAARAIA
ncbi:MAG: HEPN domain-containing protein, partial [Gemmatimonadales bacterium]